jgi:hypothetical protein
MPNGSAKSKALPEEEFSEQVEIFKRHFRDLSQEVLDEEEFGKTFIDVIFDHNVHMTICGIDENLFFYWINLLVSKIVTDPLSALGSHRDRCGLQEKRSSFRRAR